MWHDGIAEAESTVSISNGNQSFKFAMRLGTSLLLCKVNSLTGFRYI